MKIIICGVGDVGLHLARKLSQGEHHITLIDLDERLLNLAEASAEVLTVHGSSTSFEVLKQARVEEADLVLAVTSNEEVNLVTAMLARELGAARTLARVTNGEYVSRNVPVNFADMGIDQLIYPEELAAMEIIKLIERAAATDIHEFENGKLTLLGVKLDAHAEILNRAIQEVMKTITNVRFRIVLIKRDEETIIPSRDVKLQPGDQIVVIARPDGIGRILELTGKDKTRFKNIMILGGGKIGRMCASVLEKKFNVKLIESDLKKAYELSDYLSETLILQGDGRDIQLLMDESIGEMDAFVAVTEDSETNIISCLMAREMGVVKTIAHVENAEYNQLTRVIGINALVNKKMITAANITRLVRKTNIVALTHVHGMDAEVLEYVVPPESRITQKDVRNLKFPRGAILGGYVRGDDVGIVVGDTRIQSQDRVVVFSLPHCIQQVEAFFR